jgi:hypothetical protein
MDNVINTAQDDQPKPPGWVAEFNRQIKPGNWCLPVEDGCRPHGSARRRCVNMKPIAGGSSPGRPNHERA